MRHLDEGALLALLDDEMPATEAREGREHLESCATCRAAYSDLEEDAGIFAVAVAAVDREPHLLEARASINRRRRPGASRQSFLRAASLVLLAAGVASATVPGSPVRDWLRGSAAPSPEPEPVDEPAVRLPLPAQLETEEPPREAGISILPVEGSLRVLLEDTGARLIVRVRLTDGPRAEARAHGRATAARFATAEGMIRVVGARSGQLELTIPRELEHATVEHDGTVLLYKDGDGLHLSPSAHHVPGVQIVIDA